MSHRNARLAPAVRMILKQRVISGRPVAHVAKEMGISRPTAHRWLNRYRDEGLARVHNRSSRPKSCPHAASTQKTAEILAARAEHRCGPSARAEHRCGPSALAAHGAPVKRVMTDNAFAYRLSKDFQDALAGLEAKHILSKPRHPWQNGKAERFNRTPPEGWAYRHVFDSNQARTEALQPWIVRNTRVRPSQAAAVPRKNDPAVTPREISSRS